MMDGLQERIIEEAHRSRYSIHPGSTKMYRDLKEHQRPGGLAQNIKLLEWKWEIINMNFITGLPRSRRKHDSIWVIVNRMTKSAEDYAKLYFQEVVRLHGVPVSIISDRWVDRNRFGSSSYGEGENDSREVENGTDPTLMLGEGS
ncbi:hypothetical protein MTR67_033974 [Solanum verrucosum]|uniref:Integrase catalytic domain-containing protein n=1 Tax=Solanum verrucosum TaxID=315347 RepID=A0AAF0U7M6_SOLVR|nr:hypothetical protein MTR67_033974 [Solanum verrucosum]